MRFALALCCAGVLALTGCAGMHGAPVTPAPGFIYTNYKAPLDADFDATRLGSKMGSSEVTNYLGAVALGDASIKAAAMNGGLTTVNHADYEVFSVLGIYSRFKVTVYGE
ncbi:MAG: TRL-like family protein [Planctomycetes bacterium]|nr:TRL-like family protein [Planctomycetota bacterium]